MYENIKIWLNLPSILHLPSPIISWSSVLLAVNGEESLSTAMLILGEFKWLFSLIKLDASLNFQSVKYPGFVVTLDTSISPENIATTRDIGGRSVGDVWVHWRATPIILLASSSLNSDNLESTSSISRLFSCSCQAYKEKN